jgi:hypothetical protein
VTVVPLISTPLGKLSEKFTLEIESGPGLVIVNDKVDVPAGLIDFGEKAFVMLALTILAYRVETLKSLL